MFVVYHTETTIYAPTGKTKSFKTERAARAAITRMLKKNPELNIEDYDVAPGDVFKSEIELQVERVNMMSGNPYMEAINTPNYMSPACESYWSM